ncbi:MAG: hypothetical protein AAF250_03455 [Pseudomonadota bacterium]
MAQALAYRNPTEPMVVLDRLEPAEPERELFHRQDAPRWDLVRSIDVSAVCGDPRHWKGLANRALRGDRPAYRTLLAEFSEFLQLFFCRLMPERAASRAVDETLVSVAEKLGTCDTRKTILPWLLAIARYRASYPVTVSYH